MYNMPYCDMIGNVHQAKLVSSTDYPLCGKEAVQETTLDLKNSSVSTYMYKITDKLNNNNKK